MVEAIGEEFEDSERSAGVSSRMAQMASSCKVIRSVMDWILIRSFMRTHRGVVL